MKRLDGSDITITAIEATVNRLIQAANVPGLAIAILNDHKISYLKGFGLSNYRTQQPLTEHTVMYGASFTKAVFGYFVMQMVEQGMIDLDKPVEQYLAKPLPSFEKYRDLAGDERYKMITARILLSHTSGLPNWRWFNEDERLDIKFTPGTKYSYSGEGINLLQFIIEMITNQSLVEMMEARIFRPFGMKRTSMIWQESFANNYAIGHDEDCQPLGHKRRMAARAAGSMDTTIYDFAHFIQAVMQGQGLSPLSKAQMLSPQIEIYSKYQFPTPSIETTDAYRDIELAYGLGWGLLKSPYGPAYFKGGHDDGWQNYTICFDVPGIALIIMSNSSNGESIFKELLNDLIGDIYTPWQWHKYIPYNETLI